MARRKQLEGIKVRETAGGEKRYRGTAYVHGSQVVGSWTADLEEALTWRRETLEEARIGASSFERLTFGEAVRIFTAGIADGSLLNRSGYPFKPSVSRGYTRDLKLLVPIVGAATQLDRIHTPQAQLVLDRLRQGTWSDSRVRNIMVALRSMYVWAVLRGYAASNPCVGLRVPVGDERARERIATLSEARLLVGALTLPYRTALALACYAGLRAGEVLGIEWDDVDLDRPALTVRRSVDLSTGVLVKVKTKAAERDVPICDPLLAILHDHRDTHTDVGPLFPGKRPRRGEALPEGARLAYTTIRKHMYDTWTAVELQPLGMHEARHTFASMLIDAGASPKAIQTYMGHSSITITFNRYGHLMPGHEAEVLKLLNAYHETGDD